MQKWEVAPVRGGHCQYLQEVQEIFFSPSLPHLQPPRSDSQLVGGGGGDNIYLFLSWL
jgi:hypothetical protein